MPCTRKAFHTLLCTGRLCLSCCNVRKCCRGVAQSERSLLGQQTGWRLMWVADARSVAGYSSTGKQIQINSRGAQFGHGFRPAGHILGLVMSLYLSILSSLFSFFISLHFHLSSSLSLFISSLITALVSSLLFGRCAVSIEIDTYMDMDMHTYIRTCAYIFTYTCRYIY